MKRWMPAALTFALVVTTSGPHSSAAGWAESAPSGSPTQMPDLTGVEIITHPVAGNVYMLEATKDVAGNIGVSVGPDGILIIDDQFAPLTDQISAPWAELSSGKLRFNLNTHYHEDHADGNEILSQDGAVIVAHTNTRKRLMHRPKGHWPVITFDQSISVRRST